jgi:hypothetical protein
MVQSVLGQSYSDGTTYEPFKPSFDPITSYEIWYADRATYDARPLTADWESTGGDGIKDNQETTGDYFLDTLGVVSADGLTLEWAPETNKFYNGGSYGGADPTNFWRSAPYDDTADGGRYFENLVFYGRDMVGTETNVILKYTINSNTLDTDRYEIQGFIKVVDVSDGSAFIETNLALDGVTSGTYTQVLTVTAAETWAPAPLQAGFRMLGTNANPAYVASYGSFNVTIDDLILIAPDTDKPEPDPLTWETEPFTISDNKIGMRVTTATDISGVVYDFRCLTDAAFNSIQEDPYYEPNGLLAGTSYNFFVRAIDQSSSSNATGFTSFKSATTLTNDATIPGPNPPAIASADPSSQSVKLTATPGIDDSDVEYYFDCTVGDGVDSGWIRTNVYVNTSLAADALTAWTVQLRDTAANTNIGTASAAVLVTTDPFPGSVSLTNTLQSYTGTNNDDPTAHEVLKDGFEFADYLPTDRRILFDSAGANFGTFGGGDFGRNVMRTLANNYAAADFTSVVTVQGWNTNAAVFVGFGPGEIGDAGVPDWSPGGGLTNASFIVELNGTDITVWSQPENYEDPTYTSNSFKGAASWSSTSEVWGVKLDYKAIDGTCDVQIDQSYDGSTFNVEVSSGPIAIPDPLPISKIYIAGDDGIVVSNWEITSSDLPPLTAPENLVILSSDGTTATLQWTGVAGQTYDVEYSTDLTPDADAAFTLDVDNENIPGVAGTMSTTSDKGGPDTVFRIGTDY